MMLDWDLEKNLKSHKEYNQAVAKKMAFIDALKDDSLSADLLYIKLQDFVTVLTQLRRNEPFLFNHLLTRFRECVSFKSEDQGLNNDHLERDKLSESRGLEH